MDIRKILKENNFGPLDAYMHLDALHLSVLKKIAKGDFDPNVISPKVEEVLNDLISYDLVDEYGEGLTDKGERVLNYSDRLGGSFEHRKAIKNKERSVNRESEDDFEDEEEPEFF